MPDVQKPFLGVQVAFPLIKQAKLLLSYVKSSLAIVIHVYADFLAFFMLTIISMQLGTTLFNAQIAFSNTSAFYFRLPISLSIGLMTYVGSEMGKRRYKVAQKYSIAGVIIFVCSAAVLMALLYLLRDPWASFYSNDDATKKALLDTLPSFLVGCLFVDGF
jgi:MATE family multidrug resistance protein